MTSARAIPTITTPDALIASFERAGYARVAPAILQPAEPFLDLSGEDIRKRMYLTTDPQGRELCLRPDLTIPVSRDYLASPAAGKPRGFCYLGPVFRHRAEGSGEFLQAGIESFGRSDTTAADAEMLALGLDATAHYGLGAPDIRMGDVALFSALVAALDGRDRRAFSRTGRARRADLAAAAVARADRKIPRHQRRPQRGRGQAARFRSRGQDRARRRARRLRKPHRLAGRTRGRRLPHPLLDRFRSRPRLLHRFRIRAARPARARGRAAGGGRPL